MNEQDTFKCYIEGYYGIRALDEYDLKEYVLKDIEEHIRNFIETKPIPNYNYYEIAENIEKNISLIQKLQSSLIVLREVETPIELHLLIKRKISDLKLESINNKR